MASTNSSSSQTSGTVEAVSVDVGSSMLGSSSFKATNAPLLGSDPTGKVSDTDSSDSPLMSTPMLVGIIAASIIVLVVILFVIRSRRHRYKPKLFSPSNLSTFQAVTSTMGSEHNSNTLGNSATSTAVASPQPSFLQTFKLSRLSVKEIFGDDVQDVPVNPDRGTQASRTTSLISDRSVFSMSFLRGGLRSSLPSLSVFRGSRTSGVKRENELQAMDSSGSMSSLSSTDPYSNVPNISPLPIEERHVEGDELRDLSETCWSIGPGSDSETERELYTMSTTSHTQGGPLVLNRNRFSTLSDGIPDIEEEDTDVYSIDKSSRRNRGFSTLDDLSPRRERGISQFDDSSARRVRGLSALDSRPKAHSVVDIDTNESGGSYFSVDSDYYDETIKDCSSIFFDDSDCESSSDSDDSLIEEEF